MAGAAGMAATVMTADGHVEWRDGQGATAFETSGSTISSRSPASPRSVVAAQVMQLVDSTVKPAAPAGYDIRIHLSGELRPNAEDQALWGAYTY